MVTKEDYRAAIAGRSRAVDAAGVERELAAMWKSATDGDNGRQPVVRTCVMNLVVFAGSEAHASELANTVVELMARHPARALVLIADRGASAPVVDAWISAHCRLQPGRTRQVCCEQITLAARGTAADELHGATAALLLPNLPTALWWPAEVPFGARYFEDLVRLVDCVVFDSALQPDFSDVCRSLLGRRFDAAMVDLTWLELLRWRSHVAQLFDQPEHRDHLRRLDHVAFEYEPSADEQPVGRGTIEGLLMTGWLASCLGWELESASTNSSGETVEADFRHAGRRLRVAIQPGEHTGDEPGNLQSIRLLALGAAEFEVARQAEQRTITKSASANGQPVLTQTVRYEPLSRVQLVADALDQVGGDPLYAEALKHATRITRSAVASAEC